MKELIEKLRQAADVKPADCPEFFDNAADTIESQAATIARYETTAENYELLQAKVDEQAREIERLEAGVSQRDAALSRANALWRKRCARLASELAALKAQPGGVVLPPHVNTGAAIRGVLQSIGIDGDVSYHLAGQLWNACIDEVARLNSSPASAGEIPFAGFDPNFCPGSNPENPQEPDEDEARHDAVKALHDVMQAVPCASLYSLAEAVLDAGYVKPFSAGVVDERAALATLERFVETVRECYQLASSYSGCLDSVDEQGGDDHEDPICAVFHRLYYAMFDGDKALEQNRADSAAPAPGECVAVPDNKDNKINGFKDPILYFADINDPDETGKDEPDFCDVVLAEDYDRNINALLALLPNLYREPRK